MIPSPSYDTRLADWAGQDLAALATTWDQARALLEPGRERRWHRPVLTEEQQQHRAEQHRADRHAADLATRAGIKTLPATAAPADLAVVEAMQKAGWAVEMLAAELREHLQAGPLFAYDAIPITPGRTEADARFKEARRWLANSGLHAVHGDLLEHAAQEIRRALRLLTAVTDPQEYTRHLQAACPDCERRSLRAHLDAVSERDWWVQCHAPECRRRWEYDQWDDLNATLAMEVFGAVSAMNAA